MEWQVFGVISALVAFVGVFISYTSKLSTTLTTLNVTLQSLEKQLEELKKDKRQFHQETTERLDKHGDAILNLGHNIDMLNKEIERHDGDIARISKVLDVVVTK